MPCKTGVPENNTAPHGPSPGRVPSPPRAGHSRRLSSGSRGLAAAGRSPPASVKPTTQNCAIVSLTARASASSTASSERPAAARTPLTVARASARARPRCSDLSRRARSRTSLNVETSPWELPVRPEQRRGLCDHLDRVAVSAEDDALVLRRGNCPVGRKVGEDDGCVLRSPPGERRPAPQKVGTHEPGEPAEGLVDVRHAQVSVEENQAILDRAHDRLRLMPFEGQRRGALPNPGLQTPP